MRPAENLNIAQPITKACSVYDGDAERLAWSACVLFFVFNSNWPLVVCFGCDADNVSGFLKGRSAPVTSIRLERVHFITIAALCAASARQPFGARVKVVWCMGPISGRCFYKRERELCFASGTRSVCACDTCECNVCAFVAQCCWVSNKQFCCKAQ